jgi:hypothetical protein
MTALVESTSTTTNSNAVNRHALSPYADEIRRESEVESVVNSKRDRESNGIQETEEQLNLQHQQSKTWE